jgi:hypothetical protein
LNGSGLSLLTIRLRLVLVRFQNVQPGSGDYGLTVRPAGDVNVVLAATAMTAAATLGTWDTAGYQSFNIQVTGTFTATLVLEISDDNTNWNSTYFFSSTTVLPTAPSTSITAALANGFGPTRARYLRARVSAFTSNTSSAVTLVLRTVNQYPEFINTEYRQFVNWRWSSPRFIDPYQCADFDYLVRQIRCDY